VRFTTATEPIDADDATIRAALDHADLPALLTAVAHLTGDRRVLDPRFRPRPDQLLIPDYGVTAADAAEARDLAAAALARHRDAGNPAPAPLPTEEFRELVQFLIGDDQADAYLPLLWEESGLGGDLRTPTWHKDDLAPDTEFTVAIIGAGMSGIVTGHRLGQAGVPYVVLEKNDDVGGTWFENQYPGCQVDIPNHIYSYSFAQTSEWPNHFSPQKVLLDYFRQCADEFGVRPHIRFGTQVVRADFDDDRQVWNVTVRPTAGGPEETIVVQAVVSAVGQLNRPKFPDIEGQERFAGPSFHSARWRHDLDLGGKRVAVIGTGASAAQFIPPVAEQASELLVFQRTPPWLVPAPTYHEDLPDPLRWLLGHVPGYLGWSRTWLFWRAHEGLLPMAAVDPDWPHQERSVSLMNDIVREMFTAAMQLEVPDPELLAKILPTYPPIAKRVVLDDGTYTRALARENVQLITTGIAEITESGVRTTDGVDHDVDVIIYGTGFTASEFLMPMAVTGTGGVDLHERWGGEARAFLGLTIPGFPNLFLLYGPNTNIVINGSIVYFSECGAGFIVEAIRTLLAGGAQTVECRKDAHDAFNERVDAANARMAWGASSVNSWYKNASGRVAQNWPFSLLEYWEQTRTVDPADYVIR
jgi:4-hydroxyacetophenone monooxygenase